MKQLLLFEMEKDHHQEIKELKTQWERTRRSLFAKEAETKKKLNDMSHEFEMLKMYICKGKIVV